MGKSLRSKRVQKFKRIKREAYRPLEHERLIRVASKLGTTTETVVDPPPRFNFAAIAAELQGENGAKVPDVGVQMLRSAERQAVRRARHAAEKAAAAAADDGDGGQDDARAVLGDVPQLASRTAAAIAASEDEEEEEEREHAEDVTMSLDVPMFRGSKAGKRAKARAAADGRRRKSGARTQRVLLFK